jgi:hypothetical protein
VEGAVLSTTRGEGAVLPSIRGEGAVLPTTRGEGAVLFKFVSLKLFVKICNRMYRLVS